MPYLPVYQNMLGVIVKCGLIFLFKIGHETSTCIDDSVYFITSKANILNINSIILKYIQLLYRLIYDLSINFRHGLYTTLRVQWVKYTTWWIIFKVDFILRKQLMYLRATLSKSWLEWPYCVFLLLQIFSDQKWSVEYIFIHIYVSIYLFKYMLV